jgi:hypothetical protein
MSYPIFSSIFQNVNGSSFVGLDTVTSIKLAGGKKNEQQGRINKITTGLSVMVFQNKNGSAYENMVRRRLIAEGRNPDSFTLGERKWGHRITNTPFIEHNGKYYLEVICLKPGKSSYTIDGLHIDKSSINGLQKVDDDDDSQGGLDNKVIIRTYSLDSIRNIRIDKVGYQRGIDF